MYSLGLFYAILCSMTSNGNVQEKSSQNDLKCEVNAEFVWEPKIGCFSLVADSILGSQLVMLSNFLWRILGELPLIQTSGKTSWYFFMAFFIHIHKNNQYIYIYMYTVHMYNLILYGNVDRHLPLLYVYNPINNGMFSMSMSSCSFFRLRFCTVIFPTMVNVGMSPMMCFEHPGVLCAWLLSWFVVLLFLFCCLLLVVAFLGWYFVLAVFFVSCWFLIVGCCFVYIYIVVYMLFVVVISSRVGVLGFEFVGARVWGFGEGEFISQHEKGCRNWRSFRRNR